MPLVKAKTWLKYGSKFYKRGQTFSASEDDAKTLASRGRVEIEKPVVKVEKVEKVTRPYKRKDLQTAAPLVVEPPVIAPEEVPEVPAFRWPSRDDE